MLAVRAQRLATEDPKIIPAEESAYARIQNRALAETHSERYFSPHATALGRAGILRIRRRRASLSYAGRAAQTFAEVIRGFDIAPIWRAAPTTETEQLRILGVTPVEAGFGDNLNDPRGRPGMEYDGDAEDAFYARDSENRLLRLVPTHDGEVKDSLERLWVELERTKTDLSAWKWALILAHNAVQNAMADVIPLEASTLRDDLRDALDRAANARADGEREQALDDYLKALARRIRDDDPTGDLRNFLNLWDMVKSVRRIAVDGDEDQHLKRLNRERNKFTHFGGEMADFDLREYPRLVLKALEVVDFLGWSTGYMNWHAETKEAARAALDRCRAVAVELDRDYSG